MRGSSDVREEADCELERCVRLEREGQFATLPLCHFSPIP